VIFKSRNSMNLFDRTLSEHGLQLRRARTRVLQLNIGKKCNQTCAHCHVNAGPARREAMGREDIERVLQWLARTDIATMDITGGAPEMNPHFRALVRGCKELGRHVMDRCNLTICEEEGFGDLPEFFASNEVEIIASLPCYGPENVDLQRGQGVFEKSVRVLRRLNALGYGRGSRLVLNLVYNPLGPSLPPAQRPLEMAYKERLRDDFGIEFNALFALANVPIARFGAHLRREGEHEAYHQLLLEAFNGSTVEGLMCRDTLSVDHLGRLYDCDFNQMLNLRRDEAPFLWDLDPHLLEGTPIKTGLHCFACTAGAGSSCGGALA
jgi:radical SAM/Cys-rich protein